MTAQHLINRSLTLCGRLGAGRGAGISESVVALGLLNAMLDSWNSNGLTVYSIESAKHSLIANTGSYTIGLDGVFNVARPSYIEQACVVVDAEGAALRSPLKLLNEAEWSAIQTTADKSTVPRQLYNDYAYPLSTLYLYPVPSAAIVLELFSWYQMAQITTVNATVTFPFAYERALAYNLAVELGPAFKLPPRADVSATAAVSLKTIEDLNVLRRKLPVEPPAAAPPAQGAA